MTSAGCRDAWPVYGRQSCRGFQARRTLRACLKTRPVRAPGLQRMAVSAVSCRPRALTRRSAGVFKQALTGGGGAKAGNDRRGFRSSARRRPVHRGARSGAAEVFRARVEFHDTPKHASWLNMAEIEIGILERPWMARSRPGETVLAAEVAAWQGSSQQSQSGDRMEVYPARCRYKTLATLCVITNASYY